MDGKHTIDYNKSHISWYKWSSKWSLGDFFWLETRHFASCNFNNFFWFRSTLGIVLKPSWIGFLMEDYLMHPHYNNLVHGSTSGWDQSECPTKIRLEVEASPLANKEENYHGYYHGALRYWSLTPNDLACHDLGESGKYTKKWIENKFVIDIMGWSFGDFVIGSLKYRELPSLKFLFHPVRVHYIHFKLKYIQSYTLRGVVLLWKS